MLKTLMKLAVGPALLLAPGTVSAADRSPGVMYKTPDVNAATDMPRRFGGQALTSAWWRARSSLA